MGKAILVIDTPDGCHECPLAVETVHNYDACCIDGRRIISYGKFSWCPLKPAPEPKLVWYDDERSDWERGYNNCLREIVGKEN